MPYDTYRLYQVQRVKSRAEIQRADDQAGLGAPPALPLRCFVASRGRHEPCGVYPQPQRPACRARPDRFAAASSQTRFLRHQDEELGATQFGTVLRPRDKRTPARIYVNGLRVAEEDNFLFSYWHFFAYLQMGLNGW